MKTVDILYGHLAPEDRNAVLEVRNDLAQNDGVLRCENGSPIDDIARLFRKFDAWEISPQEISVQRLILESVEGGWALHEQARTSARLLLFDLCYQVICNPSLRGPNKTLEEARSRARFVADPMWIVNDRTSAEYVAENSMAGGKKFLFELATDRYNASRRSNPLPAGVDMQTLVVAGRWVDPGLPLWMMTSRTLLSVLQNVTEHGSWTNDVVRKQCLKLRAAGADRFPGQPICKVKFGGKGYKEIDQLTVVAKNVAVDKYDLGYRLRVQAARRKGSDRVAESA